MTNKHDIVIKIEGDFKDKNSLFSYALKRLWNIVFSSDIPGKLKPLGDTKLISMYNSVAYINKELNANYTIGNINFFIKEFKKDGGELERIKGGDLVSSTPVFLLEDINKLIIFIKNRK